MSPRRRCGRYIRRWALWPADERKAYTYAIGAESHLDGAAGTGRLAGGDADCSRRWCGGWPFTVGAVDVPKDNRRMHKKPIPTIGGLAIFIGFLISVLLFAEIDRSMQGILLGSVMLVVLGVLDDIYRPAGQAEVRGAVRCGGHRRGPRLRDSRRFPTPTSSASARISIWAGWASRSRCCGLSR